MLPSRRRLIDGLKRLPPEERDRLEAWAKAADVRDPVTCPARLDKLMASAGGASARYRSVIDFDGETVRFRESNRPFGEKGAVKSLPLTRWSKWAAKANREHVASLDTFILGLDGYWVHWEILDALEAINPAELVV